MYFDHYMPCFMTICNEILYRRSLIALLRVCDFQGTYVTWGSYFKLCPIFYNFCHFGLEFGT